MKKVFAAVALVVGGVSAMAEVPADVTTAISTMKTDALAVGSAVLVAIIAVHAIKFIRKAF